MDQCNRRVIMALVLKINTPWLCSILFSFSAFMVRCIFSIIILLLLRSLFALFSLMLTVCDLRFFHHPNTTDECDVSDIAWNIYWVELHNSHHTNTIYIWEKYIPSTVSGLVSVMTCVCVRNCVFPLLSQIRSVPWHFKHSHITPESAEF